jgi:uncharacterized membrane protein YgdD (TMEM256/DUF423 family)
MVVLAAIGSHGLDGATQAFRALFQTAWQIHASHAAVLLALALVRRSSRLLQAAFLLIAMGTVAFCGPLYAPALGIPRPPVFLAPVGGFLLIAGWFSIVLTGVFRSREHYATPMPIWVGESGHGRRPDH